MGMGIGTLMTGAGAANGLQELLKQRLMERQMALAEQAQRENSDYRNRSLDADTMYRNRDLEMRSLAAEEMRKMREEAAGQQAYYQEGQLVDRAANNTPNQQELPVNTAVKFKAFGQPVSGPSEDALNSPLANEEMPPYRFEGNRPTGTTKLLSPEEYQQQLDLAEGKARIGARYQAPQRPYFTFPTMLGPNGLPAIYQGNARTGELKPTTGPDGKPLQPRLTGAEQTKTNDLAEAMNSLRTVQEMFNEPGIKESIGPVAGRMNTLKSKVPESVASLPPGFARLAPAVANYRNRIIKAITGAQMGEAEATRIRQQIPELWDRADVFEAKMELADQLTQYAFSRWARAEEYRAQGFTGPQLQEALDAEMGPAPQTQPAAPAGKTYLDNNGLPIKRQ